MEKQLSGETVLSEIKELSISNAPNLNEEPGVNNFIKFLDSPGFKEQQNDYVKLLEYVSVVEKQYDSILTELNAIKSQIESTPNNKKQYESIMESARENILEIGLKINAIKDNIITFTQAALNSVKDKGFVILNEVSGFFKIKESLQSLNSSLNDMANIAEKNIEKINELSHEYQEVRNHAANIGRIIVGKESSEIVNENGRLSKLLQIPFSKIIECSNELNSVVCEAIKKVQSLEYYSKNVREQADQTSVAAQAVKTIKSESDNSVDIKTEGKVTEEVNSKDMKQFNPVTTGNLKESHVNNVFVLSELGYHHRVANGLEDIKPGQSLPQYKNKVPNTWLEKGWVKEVSIGALFESQKNQTVRPDICVKHPIFVMEP
jgi:hypothetical protein